MRTAVAALLILLLAACSTTAPDQPSPQQSIAASDITSTTDAIAWARALDNSATATELSEGIDKLGTYFAAEEVWFQTHNSLGQDLISLNADIVGNPNAAGSKVDDLQLIVDKIEDAIEKGDTP